MRYNGQKAPIRLGRGGLLTDLPPSDIPDSHLIEAKNIIVQDGTIQKDRGVRRWNEVALSTGIVDLIEWAPVEARMYVYALTRGGTIHRFTNREQVDQLSALQATDPSTLTISENNGFLVEGGREASGNAKKLFIFSRNNQIQVISGNSLTYTTIANPSADFATSNFPRFGVVHRNRLWVFNDDRAYGSDPTDQETFTGGSAVQFPIYPGEGERIQSAFVYRKQLFVFKKGGGVYQLIDSDASTANWYFQRISAEFGIAAHKAAAEISKDLLIANDKGSVTSLAAVQEFGDINLGDTFNLLKVKRFLAQLTSDVSQENRRMLYDTRKQALYIAHQPISAIKNNAFWKLDFSHQSPQITLTDKEQANCLALLSIPTGVTKPFYGSDDGFIYEMDCEDREIGLVHNPSAPLATLGSGSGSLDNAIYRFRYSYSDGSSESLWSAPSEEITVVDNSTDGKIELTEIKIDTTQNATKRIIYGKKSTDSVYTKVDEIANNTATTYTVNSDPSSWITATEPTLNSFNTGYELRFRTPNLTMQHVDPRLDGFNKHFDWVEIGFISTGLFNVSLEYWIDGIYKRARNFQVAKGPILGSGSSATTANYEFLLDTNRLEALAIRWARFKLHGNGRSISFRFSNSGQKENAIITDINCYFNLSNEDQKAIRSGKKAS